MSYQDFLALLELFNETLTATIVIVSVSILLYNLVYRTRDRVARTSSIVLSTVTLAYLADVFISLEPGPDYIEFWLRFQWLGIAFIPAALFHLSDALLATTGRPSRGRRRIVVRVCYALSTIFTLLAWFTDAVVRNLNTGNLPHMTAAPVFAIYLAYLLVITTTAIINVVRARRRCLTRYTQRRMTYLMVVFLAPAYGIFPYSLLFREFGDEQQTTLLVILNLANLIIMVMLVFMAYPLSFFGTEAPDRVVKSQLLEFMLRGPLTGAAILATILSVPRASNVLGLDGSALMPFAAVATVLVVQWSITILLPLLRRWLVYTHDQEHAQRLQRLGDRLLTQADAAQLLESILAAICDQLRVPTAFVARLGPDGAKLVQVVGALVPSPEALTAPELAALINGGDSLKRAGDVFLWHSYWLIPLRTNVSPDNGTPPLLGVLGVWARATEPNLDEEEQAVFDGLVRQAGQVLQGLQHQAEIFIILEGLASQMELMQQMRGASRYGHVAELSQQEADLLEDPGFADMVRDALRDYWGGPRLTESELLKLNVVWREMETDQESNPVRALRTVLGQAIENLRPEGERSLTTTEWVLYNILEMRFLQGRKVRDVALRLAISESDLYRKQRIAIEEVARQIEEMERSSR